MQIQTTDVLGKAHGIKCIVYGRAGMGKTTLCGTAPKPLIISAEAGLLSLRHKRLPVIEIKSLKDLEDAYKWVTTSPEAAHIETVCIDSISEIAEVCLAAAKKATKDGRKAYGDYVDNMAPAIRGFRDLAGKNVVMTAKQSTSKDEFTGMTSFGPSVPGNMLGPNLPYFFDLVLNANVGVDGSGKRYHYLRTQPDVQYEAKDRSGALDEIEYPDLTNLFAKINAAG
jgi:hypothetical protein